MRRLTQGNIEEAYDRLGFDDSLTGERMTRRQLRRLERAGIVEKKLMRNEKSGKLIYSWRVK